MPWFAYTHWLLPGIVTVHCCSAAFFDAAKRVRAAAFCASLFCLCHCVFFTVRSRFFTSTFCSSAFLARFHLALFSRVRAACISASFVVSMADGIMGLKDSRRPVVASGAAGVRPDIHLI